MAELELKVVREAIPAELRARWDHVVDVTTGSGGPATVCLLGAFSVGKSTLINLALGGDYLPHDLDETTAAPTFVEHGPTFQAFAGMRGSEEREIELRELKEGVREHGPDRWFTLKAPMPWLEGCRLVDLPGLGSKHQADRAYTDAQVEAADAVIYLVFPKGASKEDLEVLTRVARHRKDLLVVVTRCGEPGSEKPNLKKYSEEIQAAVGHDVEMIVSSKDLRLGGSEVSAFVERVVRRLGEIRSKRFVAEAQPVLACAVSHVEQQVKGLEARSEAERARILAELLDRKRQLLTARQDLNSQEERERLQVSQECEKAVSNGLTGLDARLRERRQLLAEDCDKAQWSAYSSGVSEEARAAIDAVSLKIEQIAEKYGQVRVPPLAIGSIEIGFPPRPEITAGAIFDDGSKALLDEALRERIAKVARSEQALATLPGDAEDAASLRSEIERLNREFGDLARAPLPVIEQRIGGKGFGAIVGRVIGEAADLALMFVAPTTIAAKVTATLGKGVKAAKVAKAAATALKVAKGAQKGLKVVAERVAAQKEGQAGFDKLEFLEMVSVGYWGEKIGGMFDPPEEIVTATDPEALRQRNAELEAHRAEADRLGRKLERASLAEHDKTSTEFIRNQAAREAEHIRQELAVLDAREAQQRALLQAEEARRFANAVGVRADQLVDRWTRMARRHSEGMTHGVRDAFRFYWTSTVNKALEDQMQLTEGLENALKVGNIDVEAERERCLARLEILRSAQSVVLGG